MKTQLTRPLILGTRGSPLARWQTEHVRQRIQAAWPELNCQIKVLTTTGDLSQATGTPLPEIGGKGLFTEELENALCAGEIDLAVHSLKDLPIDQGSKLKLGAICERADARDVLVSPDRLTLSQLPQGARVGTSSLRRAAQLLSIRSDLVVLPLRGNVETRLRKALSGDYAAIILAAAGVLRLGLGEYISEYLSLEVMLPAPGQGALAVQCRADDPSLGALLAPLDHSQTRATVTAERTFLQGLGGGCSAPVAAYANVVGSGSRLHLNALAASPDGSRVIRVSGEGDSPADLGLRLAQQALSLGAEGLLR